MAELRVSYETDGAAVHDVTLDGRPIAEASHADLVELAHQLLGERLAIRRILGSPGYERRAWFDKPPEERKPGAQMVDVGGVR